MVAWEKYLPHPLVCAHTQAHTYILVHTCTHVCMHVCAHTRTLTCRNTYMDACTHTCTCTRECTLTRLLLAVFRRTPTTKLPHTIKRSHHQVIIQAWPQGPLFFVLFADLGFCYFSFSAAASRVGWTDVHILFHFCPCTPAALQHCS